MTKKLEAKIAKILPNSFIDGPGNRMVLFFQGCNMACLYCHNPETQNLCKSCGICKSICTSGALDKTLGYDVSKCTNCDECIKACPNFSNPKYRTYSVDEVFSIVSKYRDFLDGITVSGGECTLYPEFLIELFTRIKTELKLTTFIDTNGTILSKYLSSLCRVTDGFMVDLKAFDDNIHKKLTGISNKIILKNIAKLHTARCLYEVRTLLVEGYNDSDDEIKNICNFLSTNAPGTRFKLIPFRPNGVKTELSKVAAYDENKAKNLFVMCKGTVL